MLTIVKNWQRLEEGIMDSDETLWIPRKISKNLKKCVQRQRLALLEFVGNLLSGSAQWYAY